MKTTDCTSARLNITQTPPAHWSRLRPALRYTFAAGAAALLTLISYAVLPMVESGEFMETATRCALQYGSPVLNVLAVLSVTAVIVQDARTSRRLPKLMRSRRVTQRLQPRSRTARA